MSGIQAQLKRLANRIHEAKDIVLSTHKMGDGDGLGSMLGMYHALNKIKKPVRAITVDEVSHKYNFLSPGKHLERFDRLKNAIEPAELALVFDTNDYRRIQPLYEELNKKCQEIIFIDHHPVLETGPKPSINSVVDASAASTGEICYFLLKEMGIELDQSIARALYTSIVFDTQRFYFIKNSEMSHKICADLCQYIKDNENIYSQLFGITSFEKMNALSKVIRQTEYFCQNKVAVIEMNTEELNKSKLTIEDACDFLDMALGINSTQISVLIINLSKNEYKLSFRSKEWNVLKLAEMFNGGGHKTASGATLSNYKKNPKEEILKAINEVTMQ